MKGKEDQLDDITRKHKPAEDPEIAHINTQASRAIHGHSHRPMSPAVREHERHGDDFAIYQAVNDRECQKQ